MTNDFAVIQGDWTPTAEHIAMLPKSYRDYVHGLESQIKALSALSGRAVSAEEVEHADEISDKEVRELNVIYEIRKIVEEIPGKLMQSELVAAIAELKRAATQKVGA
jgi:hypothetical protein